MLEQTTGSEFDFLTSLSTNSVPIVWLLINQQTGVKHTHVISLEDPICETFNSSSFCIIFCNQMGIIERGWKQFFFGRQLFSFYDNTWKFVFNKTINCHRHDFKSFFCLRYEFQVPQYYDSTQQYKILRMREI